MLYDLTEQWLSVHAVGYFGAFLIITCIHYLPESPKYYYSRREFDLARHKLEKIASINNALVSREDIRKIVFDLEVVNIEMPTNSNESDSMDTQSLNVPFDGNRNEGAIVLTRNLS